MADVAKETIVRNSASNEITSVNGAAAQTIVFDRDDRILIRVVNAGATTALVRFKAGVGMASGLGNLDVTVAQNKVFVVMLESARFKNADGKVDVEILDTDGTSFGGTVTDVDFEVYQID